MKKLFFLLIVLAFVACQTETKKAETETATTESTEVVQATINISGMHCDNCVASVSKGINSCEGIEALTVSLNDSNAVVDYDASKTDLTAIKKAIEKRGYTIKE